SFQAARSSRDDHEISLVWRRPGDVSGTMADVDLARISRTTGRSWQLYAQDLADAWLGPATPTLWAALCAALLLLLLATANLSLYFLLRTSRRTRELTIRAALGASRWRLVSGVLRESSVLAGTGCCLGILLSWPLLAWVRSGLALALPRGFDAALDGHVILAAILAAVSVAAIASIGPTTIALRAARADINRVGPANALGPRTPSAGRLFAGAQLALAIALVGVCGAMLGAVRSLGAAGLGFDAAHLVSVEFALGMGRRSRHFIEHVRSELSTLPGVSTAALATHPPISGESYGAAVWLPGRPVEPNVQYELVSPGYFRALGVPVVAGRGPVAGDTLTAQLVVVVNRAFVSSYLNNAHAIGTKLRFELPPSKWRTIVGVVDNFRDISPGRPPQPQVFIPAAQSAGALNAVVLHTVGPPGVLAPLLGPRLRQSAASFPSEVSTAARTLRFAGSTQRTMAWLFGAFGVFALLMAGLGVFALTTEAACRGRRALALRMSLGASRAQICSALLAWFVPTAVVAGIAGFILASGLFALFEALLFGFSLSECWGSAAAAVGVIAIISLSACLPPALRASRANPAEDLRAE
ncbi:MAG: FtsX-like permease family protein, partial [Terriglobales bacterium]